MKNLSNIEQAAIILVVFVLLIGTCAVWALFFALAPVATSPNNPQVAHPTGVVTKAPPPPTATPEIDEILNITGTSEDTFQIFAPETGAYFFGVAYKGDRFFAITILDSEGRVVDVPVNSIGGYDGNKMVRLKRGNYWVQVTMNDSAPYMILILK